MRISSVVLLFGLTLVGIVSALALRDNRNSIPKQREPAQQSRSDNGHGASQLRAMLRDRPEMATLVKPGDEVWEWAEHRFEGMGTGTTVFWSPECPPEWFSASSTFANSRTPTTLQIRELWMPEGLDELEARAWEHRVANKYWASAVFELVNLENSYEYRRIFEEALAGRLSQEEYIERNARLEHAACIRRKDIYWDLWQPHIERAGLPSAPHLWALGVPEAYEDWIRLFSQSREAYPWDPWGRYYETIILPHLTTTRALGGQRDPETSNRSEGDIETERPASD